MGFWGARGLVALHPGMYLCAELRRMLAGSPGGSGSRGPGSRRAAKMTGPQLGRRSPCICVQQLLQYDIQRPAYASVMRAAGGRSGGGPPRVPACLCLPFAFRVWLTGLSARELRRCAPGCELRPRLFSRVACVKCPGVGHGLVAASLAPPAAIGAVKAKSRRSYLMTATGIARHHALVGAAE
jgi:hypothetical protein